MADTELAAGTPRGNQLFAAWRNAKAQWEIAEYARRAEGSNCMEESCEDHCRATAAALNAYLLHPAEDLRELSAKLGVFRDEQIWDGWAKAEEVAACLAQDALRLNTSTSCAKTKDAASQDAEILSAWEAYSAARNDLAAMDDASPDGSTAADSAIWQKVDDAEKVICAAQAKTLQGIQCQLATALYHLTSGRELSRAVLAGDFDRLAQAEKSFDWPVQLLFAAIKGIRAMQPA